MQIFALIAALLLVGSGVEGRAPDPVAGAKELFYDPSNDSVSNGAPERPLSRKSNLAPAPPAMKPKADAAGRRTIDRVANPQNQNHKSLGLSYWIELADPKGGPGTQVTDHRVFRSGERIRLHFSANADGLIALLQLGSSGGSNLLFPDPEHGLPDATLFAGRDRVLPNETFWFRFDDRPGTERLVALFARHRQDLEPMTIQPAMDAKATQAVLETAAHQRGSKDLFIETETQAAAEIGTYGVTLSGQPVILEITLKHE